MKKIISQLTLLTCSLGVVFGVNALALAAGTWTPAPANPPANNTETPLNVGGIGQQKEAGLWLATSPTVINGLVVQNGNVGIGTVSPTHKLQVNGKVKIVDGSQSAGKVLVSDANGVGTWSSAVTTGACTVGQYIKSISASGVATCGNFSFISCPADNMFVKSISATGAVTCATFTGSTGGGSTGGGTPAKDTYPVTCSGNGATGWFPSPGTCDLICPNTYGLSNVHAISGGTFTYYNSYSATVKGSGTSGDANGSGTCTQL